MSLSPSAAPQWELLDLDQDEQEYLLFDSVICEKTDIGGFDIMYYIKEGGKSKSDYLYGEDANTKYSEGYRTKLLYDPTEETQILNILGMTSDDNIMYAQIPKTLFNRDVSSQYPSAGYDIPQISDVVKTLWNNKSYEIAELGSEQKIFQGQKLVWEFVLKPYRYSEEDESGMDILLDAVEPSDFPEINMTTTTTEELSAYGENVLIERESREMQDELDYDYDMYGY